MFTAVTDYGNCAYKWTHHGCSDFREFIAKLETGRQNDCYIKKLFGCKDIFDSERTIKDIKKHILENYRDGTYSKTEAREEWELIKEYEDGMTNVGFGMWYERTNISDAYEFAVYDYSTNVKAFGSELLPRLAEVLKHDIEKN